MSLRQYIVALVAGILRVTVTFSQPQKEEERPNPKNKDYRLSRRVWYDGTVSDELQIALSAAHDRRLSFGARGLLLVLASPHAPRVLIREVLENASPTFEGFSEVLTYLRELAFLGYLETSEELLSDTVTDPEIPCAYYFRIREPYTEGTDFYAFANFCFDPCQSAK